MRSFRPYIYIYILKRIELLILDIAPLGAIRQSRFSILGKEERAEERRRIFRIIRISRFSARKYLPGDINLSGITRAGGGGEEKIRWNSSRIISTKIIGLSRVADEINPRFEINFRWLRDRKFSIAYEIVIAIIIIIIITVIFVKWNERKKYSHLRPCSSKYTVLIGLRVHERSQLFETRIFSKATGGGKKKIHGQIVFHRWPVIDTNESKQYYEILKLSIRVCVYINFG